MPASKIKKNDQVLVLAGKDRGKRGSVVELFPQGRKGRKVAVEGVNVLKRHRKARGPGKPSGIIEFNGPIHVSNVMLVCPKCDKPTRIATKTLPDGSRKRACKNCGEMVDD